MKQSLWNKNFILLTLATVLGAAGGVAASFALSFPVFDETGSTLASALLLAARILPNFLPPLVAGDAAQSYLPDGLRVKPNAFSRCWSPEPVVFLPW